MPQWKKYDRRNNFIIANIGIEKNRYLSKILPMAIRMKKEKKTKKITS